MGYFADKMQQADTDTKTKTNFIPNPLPVPKRRAHVEMDFDQKIPESMLFYDIENPKEDYFDID